MRHVHCLHFSCICFYFFNFVCMNLVRVLLQQGFSFNEPLSHTVCHLSQQTGRLRRACSSLGDERDTWKQGQDYKRFPYAFCLCHFCKIPLAKATHVEDRQREGQSRLYGQAQNYWSGLDKEDWCIYTQWNTMEYYSATRRMT